MTDERAVMLVKKCLFTFFLFSDSGIYLLNGLVYSEWRDTEKQQ